MGHNHEEDLSHLSKEELLFRDYMNRGNDFMKIEIYRHAKTWFTRALELNINNELAKERLDECFKLIKKEIKIIATIAIIVVVVIGMVLLIN
ncbi:MAG: hypothetical protein HY738_02800 [Bacteroidia bacterium]|nr:hypothetical protein [Bacteroidia bacterium]